MATIRKKEYRRQGRKKPTTTWQVRYVDPGGRERAKNFPTEAEARTFRDEVETEKRKGTYVDPRRGGISLGEWAERYMAMQVDLKPKTVASYESLLRSVILPTFGTWPLSGIEQPDVQEWVAREQRRGLSASRVRQAYHLLGAMMRAAVSAKFLTHSPCDEVRIPRLPRVEAEHLSADEVGRLAAAVQEVAAERQRQGARQPDYGTLIYLLAYGGLRWGEAVALKRRRVDLKRSRIEVAESVAEVGGRVHFGFPKTHQSRTIAIPPFLRDRLAGLIAERGLAPDELVFESPKGGVLRYSNFRRKGGVWSKALERAEVSETLGVHALRHTCASLLIRQGAHPKEIQAHLGHSSIQVTMDRYGHLYPDQKDRLAADLQAVFDRTGSDSRRTLPADNVVPMQRPPERHAG